jgi:hypothetical protein
VSDSAAPKGFAVRPHLEAFARTISREPLGLTFHRPEAWATPTDVLRTPSVKRNNRAAAHCSAGCSIIAWWETFPGLATSSPCTMQFGTLRFYDRDRIVSAVAQNIVRTLLPPALRLAADEDHATVGEGALFVDGVRHPLPARRLQARNNEFSGGVGFCHHSTPRHLSASLLPVGRNYHRLAYRAKLTRETIHLPVLRRTRAHPSAKPDLHSIRQVTASRTPEDQRRLS